MSAVSSNFVSETIRLDPVAFPDIAYPKVSVLMLTCNRPRFLNRAIQSVLDQSFGGWELIVVQDGPNEQTAAVMETWVKRDPRIHYFRRAHRGNIANACNYGISRARGEYVAILDDDDYWAAKDKLARQVAFLDDNPDYAGCGAGMALIDESGGDLMSYLKPERDEDIKSHALCSNPMAHSTTMFRRSLGSSIGFYDESLAGFQDWDLWLRLSQVGKLYNFPEVFTRYTLWHGGGSFQQQRRNALSALKIVLRHRSEYEGFAAAFALVILHFAYAHLPSVVRKASFSFLSRLKKTLFAGRHRRVEPQAEPDRATAIV